MRKGTSRSSYSNSYSKTNYEREGKSLSEKPRENPTKAIVQESGKREEEKKKIERIKRLEKHLAHLGYEFKGIELIEEKLNRMIHKEERKEKEQKERRESKEQQRQDKCLSRAEPNIDIKSSSLEPFCEKLSEHLFGAEIDVDSSSIEKSCEELVEENHRDINTNSSYTEKFSEDIFVEQSLFGAELDIGTKTSLIEKPCELLEIKQEDQNIRQTHRV